MMEMYHHECTTLGQASSLHVDKLLAQNYEIAICMLRKAILLKQNWNLEGQQVAGKVVRKLMAIEKFKVGRSPYWILDRGGTRGEHWIR